MEKKDHGFFITLHFTFTSCQDEDGYTRVKVMLGVIVDIFGI